MRRRRGVIKIVNGWYIHRVNGGFSISPMALAPCLPITFIALDDAVSWAKSH